MSELNKKMMQTPNLKEERLESLKQLFPDLFTLEGKLNPDELKKIIDPDLVKETERFEFKWFGKSEAKRNAFTPSKATLVYDEERSVNSEYANGNMIIEGENLETLKCLLSAYRERIKCIYIDPPYNTGKDFVYSDKWDENKEDYWKHIGVTENGVCIDTNLESEGRFHSNWLNLIYPRLLLARQLLKDDGVIFISINDREISHLKKVCDEVYGEKNLISILVWDKGHSAQAGIFKVYHEYVLLYAKNIELVNTPKSADKELFEAGAMKKESNRHQMQEFSFPAGVRWDAPSGTELKNKWGDTEKVILIDGRMRCTNGKTTEKVTLKAAFTQKNQMHQYFYGDKNNLIDSRNQKIVEFYFNSSGKIKIVKERGVFTPKTTMNEYGTQSQASVSLAEIFGFSDTPVDNPKPVKLIKDFVRWFSNDEDIILDFFSGSGTTAHAVIDFNQENGETRAFILIQLPEIIKEDKEAYKAGYKKIFDITIERNKRVIQKLEKEEAEKQLTLLDSDKKPFKTGFKVYNLAKSNFPRVDFAPDPTKTEEENLDLLNKYIDEKEAMFLAMVVEKNIFDEVLLKNGFMLNYLKIKADGFSKNNVFQIKDNFKECLICMDMSIAKETLKELEPLKEKIFLCLERALDTTMKWNLKHFLGDKLIAF